VIAIFADSSELTAQIRALMERIADLHAFINGLNSVVIATDSTGKVAEWNDCAEKAIGLPRDAVLGKELVSTLVAMDDRASVTEAVAAGRDGCDGFKGVTEIRFLGQDGVEVPLRLGLAPRLGADGDIVGVSVSGHPLKIEEDEESSQDVADGLGAWKVLEVDKEGVIDFWHIKTVGATETPADQAMGVDCKTIVLGEEEDTVAGSVSSALGGKDTSGRLDCTIATEAGEFPFILAFVPRRAGAKGTITGAVAVGFDNPSTEEESQGMTLEHAWAMLSQAHWVLSARQIHDCLVRWQYNREISYIMKINALSKWADRVRELEMRTMYRTILALRVGRIESAAEEEAYDKVNKRIADGAPDQDGAEFNPDLIIVWEYKDESDWKSFDRQTMFDIEYAHETGVLKIKIVPANEELMHRGARGTYLVIIHSRLMVDIATGANYEIRRRMPAITYTTLEVGAVGPGDRASSE